VRFSGFREASLLAEAMETLHERRALDYCDLVIVRMDPDLAPLLTKPAFSLYWTNGGKKE